MSDLHLVKPVVSGVTVPSWMKEMVTDEQRALRDYNLRCSHLEEMLRGLCNGFYPGIVIDGGAGTGKSFLVNKILEEFEKSLTVHRYSGKITPLDLYNNLANNSTETDLSVFDDCDDAFNDPTSLNTLKAALDLGKDRLVVWGSSTSKALMPRFHFRGKIVVITNADLGLSEHYRAFLNRVMRFRVHMNGVETLAKIWEMAMTSDEFKEIDEKIKREVYKWLRTHQESLGKDLSLRTFGKLVSLARMSPRWEALAASTMQNQG